MGDFEITMTLKPPFVVIRHGVTEEEFYRDATEDSDWEYLDGRLFMHSPASDRLEDHFRFLITLLSTYLDERGGAVVRGSRYPMRLDERWSPEPDLLVVRSDQRHRMTRTRLEGPANFVIEIASEGDPRFDIREKLPRYREAGIEEIWVFDASEQAIFVEALESTGYVASRVNAGRLRSPVIPGFWIDVGWLWQEPLPPTLACIREILAGG